MPVSSRPPPGLTSSFPPADAGERGAGARAEGLRAYRVSVQRSSDGALTVRSLRDGEKVPAGSREAILVFSGTATPSTSEGD